MPCSYDRILYSNFEYIPEEILVEILKRLPVKSLLRCMCVQKSWYNLIRTPMFIDLHFNHQRITTTHNHKNLLFTTKYDRRLLLQNDDYKQCQESQLKVEFPPDFDYGCVVSVSSGLVCLYAHENFHLWNPFIQKYKTIPSRPPLPSGTVITRSSAPNLAFGYVPQLNDYRIVRIICYTDVNNVRSFVIFIYSLSTNSWKTKIIQDKLFIRLRGPGSERISVNGAAFWIGTTMEGVKTFLCFDIVNDILRTIALPAEALLCKPLFRALHQFGQSIAYFVEDPDTTALKMWLLKEGSMNEFFWEKKICVSLMGINYSRVLGVRNNCELILSNKRNFDLISYNVEKDVINDFVHSWHQWFPPKTGMYTDIDTGEEIFCHYLRSVSPFLGSLLLLHNV